MQFPMATVKKNALYIYFRIELFLKQKYFFNFHFSAPLNFNLGMST
jgi:hypothetical protein